MKNENYLEKIPMRASSIRFGADEAGIVTLEIENKGVINKVAQTFFKKPKVSYVHLDKLGSYIWSSLDGEKDVFSLGKEVEEKFGEVAHPLYERLIKYLEILSSYQFIIWK